MSLLEGKTLLITGVMTESSIAHAVAELCLEQGAEVILTGAGRAHRLTVRTARKLAERLEVEIPVYELDVTVWEQGRQLQATLADEHVEIDGVLHAIGFMPEAGLEQDLLAADWDELAVGFQISSHSLAVLTRIVQPLMPLGGDIIALDFDNSSRAWGPYGHMGPAKAALQAYVRSLAAQLGPSGIRCNAVAAGPLRTTAARSIPGFDLFESVWDKRAPLGWDVKDTGAVAKACLAIFAGMFPRTTGAVIPVDGGYMIAGA